MRILLDECVPRRFRRELPQHEVQTVPEMGWASLKNGDLLAAASGADARAVVPSARKERSPQRWSSPGPLDATLAQARLLS